MTKYQKLVLKLAHMLQLVIIKQARIWLMLGICSKNVHVISSLLHFATDGVF